MDNITQFEKMVEFGLKAEAVMKKKRAGKAALLINEEVFGEKKAIAKRAKIEALLFDEGKLLHMDDAVSNSDLADIGYYMTPEQYTEYLENTVVRLSNYIREGQDTRKRLLWALDIVQSATQVREVIAPPIYGKSYGAF